MIPEESSTQHVATRFLIHSKDEVRVILFKDVVCCVADSNYTRIHLMDGSKVMVSKTLKNIQGILYPSNFIRIHASYLVNLHFIKKINKTYPCLVELPNNAKLVVSRSRREALINKVASM